MRLHRLLGERRLSWIRRRCHRQLRRPEFPRSDHRGVGGVTPPLGLLAAQHAAQARGEAGVTAGGGQGQIEKNLRKAITYAASNQRVRIAFAYASFNAFVRSSAS